MIREKLAIQILKSMKKAMGFGKYKTGHWELMYNQERQIYLDMADQQIAIFKEMLDTMELPFISLQDAEAHDKKWAQSNFADSLQEFGKIAQQDLLKAIKKECDKE